jgi:hypothetical protein
MGTLLQFYLLHVTALFVAFIGDYLSNRKSHLLNGWTAAPVLFRIGHVDCRGRERKRETRRLTASPESASVLGDCLLPEPKAVCGSAWALPFLHRPHAIQDDPRLRSVSRAARRTDKDVVPIFWSLWLRASTTPIPAHNARNRREYHVVSP